MNELMEKLQYAKKNVLWLLEHGDGLVDMHSIAYWAGEVERLRIEVKKVL